MQTFGKSTFPGFTRGTSKPFEDKKKKSEVHESPSESVKEINERNKQIQLNHASQMAAMQNRLIAMERSQRHKSHPKHNDKWKKKPHFQEQRPPNTLESANYVDNQAIPYCRPCGTFHEASTCHFSFNFVGVSLTHQKMSR